MILFWSVLIGLVLGTCLGNLIVRMFNNGLDPMTIRVKETSDYDIMKEF